MKKVGLLGLAGNPPTLGHLSLGKHLISYKVVDEVWYMPCYEYNGDKKLESSEHRLEMLKILLKDEKFLKVFDFEIENKLDGKLYNTVELLNKNDYHKFYDFYFIIGQDNANNIEKWYKYRDLLKLMKFIVLNRKGYEENDVWYKKSPHKYFDFKSEKEISSTMVRNLLLEKESRDRNNKLLELIDQKIFNYIKKNNLYT